MMQSIALTDLSCHNDGDDEYVLVQVSDGEGADTAITIDDDDTSYDYCDDVCSEACSVVSSSAQAPPAISLCFSKDSAEGSVVGAMPLPSLLEDHFALTTTTLPPNLTDTDVEDAVEALEPGDVLIEALNITDGKEETSLASPLPTPQPQLRPPALIATSSREYGDKASSLQESKQELIPPPPSVSSSTTTKTTTTTTTSRLSNKKRRKNKMKLAKKAAAAAAATAALSHMLASNNNAPPPPKPRRFSKSSKAAPTSRKSKKQVAPTSKADIARQILQNYKEQVKKQR